MFEQLDSVMVAQMSAIPFTVRIFFFSARIVLRVNFLRIGPVSGIA
jgi:hypothetical protein